jgi:type IV pilus assembly protein PilW
LGLVIILGVTTLFVDSSRTLGDISRAGRQLENSLFALDLLAGELALVGYWGEADYPVVADDPTFGPLRASETDGVTVAGFPMPPGVCVGTGGSGFDPRVELGWAMEYPLVAGLGTELDAALGSAACSGTSASTPNADEEFVVIRRASTCATGNSGLAAANSCPEIGNFFHLQANGCYNPNEDLSGGELKLYRVTGATSDNLLNYRGFECDANTAPMYRYVARVYYLNQQDQLVRLQLEESGAYEQQVLAEGIEALRFEWLIDRSGDGDYDVITSTADSAWSPAMRAADWQNVVGAKIWMIVRSGAPQPGYTDTNVYNLPGRSWDNEQPAYTRLLRSRAVDLVNIAGRRR